MGINYAVSDKGDADGPVGEPIDQRTIELGEALEMLVKLTHDMGANIEVEVTYVDETKVAIYYTYYIGPLQPNYSWHLHEHQIVGFFYLFEKDPHDDLDTFDKFAFAAASIVNSVPWICSQRVLRRVVGGDKMAYQPA